MPGIDVLMGWPKRTLDACFAAPAMNQARQPEASGTKKLDYDVIVIGAGLGGIYALIRLQRQGLSVLGLETADGIGGVWYHNRYPGARVDVESLDYCYHFSPELFQEWRWSERYASQEELLRYINHVADGFDIRKHICLGTALAQAQWSPETARYTLLTGTGQYFTCRFLIMATGNLSAARRPDFPGLADFKGSWIQASHWPREPVMLEGRRVAVIGTGSSGVQIVPVAAQRAAQLYVFQRTPNFSVPARNMKLDPAVFAAAAQDVAGRRALLLTTRAGNTAGLATQLPYAAYGEDERLERLERQWAIGGQGMNRIFADQGVDRRVNDVVADFVRGKIIQTVQDPVTARLLCPHDHPIGTRRLCMDSGYYESFNRANVSLVNVADDPIERITPTGIQTRDNHYEVDLIIFALGFHAFRGALENVDIRNAEGAHPTDRWNRGPRSLLGLMTSGFPNFFFLTGPGSPSVLANMVLMNEEHVNFVADLIGYMATKNFDIVEPEAKAEEWWTARVAEAASKLLRLEVRNYMVHINQDDGSRVFMPYAGGLDSFTKVAREIAAKDFEGFEFRRVRRGVAGDLESMPSA
jgi:cation diffusion facilitator CzcD-associated flavoprotein CzcO